jgi:hypothetical protein
MLSEPTHSLPVCQCSCLNHGTQHAFKCCCNRCLANACSFIALKFAQLTPALDSITLTCCLLPLLLHLPTVATAMLTVRCCKPAGPQRGLSDVVQPQDTQVSARQSLSGWHTQSAQCQTRSCAPAQRFTAQCDGHLACMHRMYLSVPASPPAVLCGGSPAIFSSTSLVQGGRTREAAPCERSATSWPLATDCGGFEVQLPHVHMTHAWTCGVQTGGQTAMARWLPSTHVAARSQPVTPAS